MLIKKTCIINGFVFNEEKNLLFIRSNCSPPKISAADPLPQKTGHLKAFTFTSIKHME